METATIFYRPGELKAGNPMVFEVRFDDQFLPQHVIVVGFIARMEGGILRFVFHRPVMKLNQVQSWKNCIDYAKAMMMDDHLTIRRLEGTF